MKYSEIEYVNNLVKQINETEETINKIDNLINRTLETAYEYQREIKIQLAEQYIHTPVATVSLDNFILFLKKEKEILLEKSDEIETILFNFIPEENKK